MWKFVLCCISQESEWGEEKKCFLRAKRAPCGWASQGQLFSQSSVFTSPQTQSHWNMWFWSAHVRGRGQLKHQHTMITHYTTAMRTTCQIKPKRPDPSPCFQSCPVPWEPCSRAYKQWLCIHWRRWSPSLTHFNVVLDYSGWCVKEGFFQNSSTLLVCLFFPSCRHTFD